MRVGMLKHMIYYDDWKAIKKSKGQDKRTPCINQTNPAILGYTYM